jgi:hypothetical protein
VLITDGYEGKSGFTLIDEFPNHTCEDNSLFAVQDSTPASDQTIIFTGVIREFVYQGETAFALVSISDQHNLSIRFGTDSSGSQNLMRTGDTLRLGLKRSETIIIPKPST